MFGRGALCLCAPKPRDVLEGKAPQRQPKKRLDRRLEEVSKAVGGGYCRLQMPLKLALVVKETVHGHRLGSHEGVTCAPSNASLPKPASARPAANSSSHWSRAT